MRSKENTTIIIFFAGLLVIAACPSCKQENPKNVKIEKQQELGIQGSGESIDEQGSLISKNSESDVIQSNKPQIDVSQFKNPRPVSDQNESFRMPKTPIGNAQKQGGQGDETNVTYRGREEPLTTVRDVPLPPINPIRIESSGSSNSDHIAYPAIPSAIGISSDQIDLLQVPQTDLKRSVIGIWEQTGIMRTSDIAEGNYTRSTLVFRVDGELDVVRWFGPQQTIRLDSKFTYSVIANGIIRIDLPEENTPGNQQGLSIPLSDGTSIRIDPQTINFPVSLPYAQHDTQLILDGKTYSRREPL